VYEVLTVQRDYGNRSDRKLARLKYTLDKYGVEWFKNEVEKRTAFALEEARPYRFNERTDLYGWQQSKQGLWYYTVFVENGRVVDNEKVSLKSALLEVAKTGNANFRFTCNQNVILADIQEEDKPTIQQVLEAFRINRLTELTSALRRNSMACVALNTCPLALAEAQRYLPTLISKIEPLLRRHGLEHEEIVIRMTGCPNGCARPYIAEIGLVGTALGHYNLYLGGDRQGERLNKLYRENLEESAILSELDGWLGRFKSERIVNESFGDFALREVRFK
jgi:sulfite reductase (NADPH) hemoprotein beta-component